MQPPGRGEGGDRDGSDERARSGRRQHQRRLSEGAAASASAASLTRFGRGRGGGGWLPQLPELLLLLLAAILLLAPRPSIVQANLLTPISMGIDLGNHKRCVHTTQAGMRVMPVTAAD